MMEKLGGEPVLTGKNMDNGWVKKAVRRVWTPLRQKPDHVDFKKSVGLCINPRQWFFLAGVIGRNSLSTSDISLFSYL